jgi:valyl-tRNA synthetase
VHRAVWPSSADLVDIAAPDPSTATSLAAAIAVLGEIRRAKSETKRPLKAVVARAIVRDTPARLAGLEHARGDLAAAANIQTLDFVPSDEFSVSVEFAETEPVTVEPRV